MSEEIYKNDELVDSEALNGLREDHHEDCENCGTSMVVNVPHLKFCPGCGQMIYKP
jgi:predicted RNA-binding Zn-ribbon protein involved in translation (DUF1610 family)